MDDNTYTDVKYKRTVTALFSKMISNTVSILCYWLDGINYISLYGSAKDSIMATHTFCIYPDEGESFVRSILFSNNYIFTIETTEKTIVKLIEIDYINGKFIERKNIIMSDTMFIEDANPGSEKYKMALKLVGISATGELLEEDNS